MKKISFIKGFSRLGIALFFIMVGVNSAYLFKECHEHMDFVLPHLSPVYSDTFFNEKHWCAVIASPNFLERPLEERIRQADTFFSEHIEPFCTDCLDIKKFRAKFVRSANLTLEEAPIQIWEKYHNIPYRDISSYSWHEGIEITRIIFNWGVLLISAIEAALISGVITSVIAMFVWIKKGFWE